jgi:hypothetical protein
MPRAGRVAALSCSGCLVVGRNGSSNRISSGSRRTGQDREAAGDSKLDVPVRIQYAAALNRWVSLALTAIARPIYHRAHGPRTVRHRDQNSKALSLHETQGRSQALSAIRVVRQASELGTSGAPSSARRSLDKLAVCLGSKPRVQRFLPPTPGTDATCFIHAAIGAKEQIEGAVARPYCARSAPFL